VRSKSFVEKVKELLGIRAKGRDVLQGSEGYQVREEPAPYNALFRAEKDDIGLENTYLWDIKTE
jgi:putative transposase